MKDLLHVSIGCCCCLLRAAPVLTRAHVRRVPVPPVMLGVCLLELAVTLLCFVEKLCKGRDVHGSCFLPLATGEPGCYLLQQPLVPVGILERSKRKIAATFRVAP